MAKAQVFRRDHRKLWPGQKVEYSYFFTLIGDNGEIVAQSEAYTQKHNAVEVLAKYFPNFDVIDQT